MPLPEPKAARTPLHRRSIEIRGFRRDDGLFEVEGRLLDTKEYDFAVDAGVRKAGEPVHSMWLRIAFTTDLEIVEAVADTDGMPYAAECDRIAPDYRRLVGLRIGPGYLRKLKELFGGVRGCTHVTELAGSLATAAFQTLAGQVRRDPHAKPWQIDKCHALEATGRTVARHYPRWYRGNEKIAPAQEPDSH